MIFIISTIFTNLFSAKFKIDSFTRLADDLRVGKEVVKDINGDTTALIKVKTDLNQLQFESNLYPAKIEKKTGEYFIYLSEGDRKISFLKEGYQRKDYYFPEKIKANIVYYLKLSSEDLLPKTIKIAAAIQTIPAGARIYLDNQYLENSEQIKTTVGEHELKVIMSGHEVLNKKIFITPEQTFFKYKLKEKKDIPIFINSSPEGATVYIDDVKIGKTPVSSFYPAGTFKIKIIKKSFEPLEEFIDIKTNRVNKHYALEDNSAILSINTYQNAEIYLNDLKQTKHQEIKLTPQIYNLKIIMNDVTLLEQRIILKNNEKRILNLYPEMENGKIQVSVIPENAVICLYGDKSNKYEIEDSIILKDIPIGIYNLKVSKKGYQSYSSTVKIEEGKLSQKILKLKKGSDNGGEFIFIKGGFFTMGSDDGGSDETPEHKVKVRNFFVGKYEITQAEWKAVMKTNPAKFNGSWFSNNDNHPVENISWLDAVKYCNKRSLIEGFTPCYTIEKNENIKCNFFADGYRLPTEAEWEYACKGGTSTPLSNRYKYAGSNNIDEVGWYSSNSEEETHPVGEKKGNEFKIYDMSGNVWEWCWDYYDEKYYTASPSIFPTGPSSGKGRVIRGGSWNVVDHYLRLSDRSYDYYNRRGSDRGLRLFRTAK